ncbi:hypothetical protein [Methylomonas sp. AM2-LC]|uniref:hypothetical protein n=1 Tax=Methylomonas sp. AM2-LC TaxID=3153301 RepID=UPI0032650180
MCDGFSEAFLAAASVAGTEGGTAAAGIAAGEATSVGLASTATASTMGSIGAYAGAGIGSVGSMLGTGTALSLASSGLSGYNQYLQSNAQQQSALYQSKVEANNAQLALDNRSSTLQAGQAAAMQSEQQAAQVLGEQRAGLAGNGVMANSGSAVDLLTTTHFLNNADVNTIQANAAMSAWGYSQQAQNYSANSALSNWQAKNSSPGLAAAMTGGSTLLTSGSRYAMGNAGNLMFTNRG